ncbi:hypothetical protein ACFL1A_03640, partial [Patescibacteria group bacterium]
MFSVIELFRIDFLQLVRQFKQNKISKLLVGILFLGIFVSISFLIYRISSLFFTNLTFYEIYGKITTKYIINVAIVVIWWIGVASGLTASINVIVGKEADFVFLRSMPLSNLKLSVYLLIKSILSNFILLVFVFAPVIFAYSMAFQATSVWFLARSIITLSSLTVFSLGAAAPILFFMVKQIRRREYGFSLAGLVLFFVVFLGLIKFIFPKELYLLNEASIEQFPIIVSSLPLNKWWMPSLWMARAIVDGSTANTILLFFASCGIFLLTLAVWSKILVKSVGKASNLNTHSIFHKSAENALLKFKFPIFYKDLLSIIRSSGEVGYGLFLSFVALFFFLFLKIGLDRQMRLALWRKDIMLFSFSWMSFFAAALFLRILFPLIAREGKNIWFIFTQPVKRSDIYFQKLLFGIFVSIPVMIFSAVIWVFFPPFLGIWKILTAVSLLTILLLAIVHVSFGAIYPNYNDGDSPEKVST